MAGGYKNIRVATLTLGCKLNQAESELLARKLTHAGYRVVSAADEADVCILNSCTVTHIADRKSRQALRAMRERNPRALLIATGCYAERAPHTLSEIEGVSIVLANAEKTNLVDLIDNHFAHSTATTENAQDDLPVILRTRAFVKIQDGCNSFCAYCIVPYVRGCEKSLPADQIVAEVRELVTGGYKEVVLTGTEIGSYRYDGINLKELIKRILSETGVTRLRLSSLQPQEISPEFTALWRDSRMCHHFHLSLQSGSETVLRRMKRRYSLENYQQAVSLIMSQLPEAAITTDVIVGFPGETEEELDESYRFCQKMHFARIHVFPYSARPGTEAAFMPGQVSDRVKKERSQKMLALSKECARGFRQQFLDKTMTVLWEQPSGNGIWSGLTDNYIKVHTKSDVDLTNKLTEVRLVRTYKDGVWGEIDLI